MSLLHFSFCFSASFPSSCSEALSGGAPWGRPQLAPLFPLPPVLGEIYSCDSLPSMRLTPTLFCEFQSSVFTFPWDISPGLSWFDRRRSKYVQNRTYYLHADRLCFRALPFWSLAPLMFPDAWPWWLNLEASPFPLIYPPCHLVTRPALLSRCFSEPPLPWLWPHLRSTHLTPGLPQTLLTPAPSFSLVFSPAHSSCCCEAVFRDPVYDHIILLLRIWQQLPTIWPKDSISGCIGFVCFF